MIFKKSELKRKISVLLIVALIFGMTNSYFAISDLELQKNGNTNQSQEVKEENTIEEKSEKTEIELKQNSENDLEKRISVNEIDEAEKVDEVENKEEVDEAEEIEEAKKVEEAEKIDEADKIEEVKEIAKENIEKEEEPEENINEPEAIEDEKEEALDEEENVEINEATDSDIENDIEDFFESEEEDAIEEVKLSTGSEIKEESKEKNEEEVSISTESIIIENFVISTASLFSAPTHTHGSDVYVAINSESDLTSITTSYVYLENDIKLNNEVNLSQFDNKELHICLNGKTLKYENGVTIFDVSNEEKLYISDCNTLENAGHIVSTESTVYDNSFIKVSGTGEVTVDNINLNELDLNGSFIEAIDGGQAIISDANLEYANFKKAALYAYGTGSKISFINTNYIGINTVENDSILSADNGACIEITSGETKVKSNSSKKGGVMHLTNHSKFVLSGTLIASANNAEKGGFAYIDNTVSFQTSSGEIDIEEGIANYGGGLYIEIVNDENFFNNPMIYNIKNNKANNDGGGVYLDFKVNANFIPNMQGIFNLEKNEGKKGAGLYIGSSEGKKKVEIKNINFNNHKLNENESLIETNIDADISNLKIESINKDADALGQLISNGTLIRACANDNKITISNIFLANEVDKINRANKGIELTKENNKTIDLTISTYSLLDKIAFGIDIANIADDNQSKVTLNNIYTDYSANYEEFLVPLMDDFPRPENFYTQLTSLQGDGSRPLSLDYIPNFTTRWDISYQFNAGAVGIGAAPYSPGYTYANSGYNLTGRFGFISLSGNDHIQCAFGNSASNYYYHCYHNARHNMYIDAYNRRASNGADTINGNGRGMYFNNPGNFVKGVKPLYIFGVNSSHGVKAHAGIVWSSKISESGVLIRDFIPIELTKDIPRSMDHYGASRKAGSKGLWDKVNEEFYEYTSGIATCKVAETGIYIFNSTIPITFNNLCISGVAKRSVYIEKSQNINFIDTKIENCNTSTSMIDSYVKVLENSEIDFTKLEIENNVVAGNSIIDVKDSIINLREKVEINDNTCTSTVDKKSSVICIEKNSQLNIKTEEIEVTGNATKKGVISAYDDAKINIQGELVVTDNYLEGDASKKLNIYLGSANAHLAYDETENKPIKETTKIGITSASLDSAVFKNWNKNAIEKYNDGSDITKEIYLPDNIFIPDTAHISSNQLLYKKGINPETNLCIGANFVKLDYMHGSDLIGSQRVAKNVETTIDSIYLVGTPAEIQSWEGPTLADENVNEFWGVTNTTKTVKITTNKIIDYVSHNHLICGDDITGGCSHSEYIIPCDYICARNGNEFITNLSKYKAVYLVDNILVNSSINMQYEGTYNICLNGHELIFVNGINAFNVTGNRKLNICNCKGDGFVAISTLSQIGNDPAIKSNGCDFAIINTKIANLDNCKTALLNMTGDTSNLYISNVEFIENNVEEGKLINIDNINVATFNNVLVRDNTFIGSSNLLNIKDAEVYIDNVEIDNNVIGSSLIVDTDINIVSKREYWVHGNKSQGTIITSKGDKDIVGKVCENETVNGVYNLLGGTYNINENLEYTENKGIKGALFNTRDGVIININSDLSNVINNEAEYGTIIYGDTKININTDLNLSQNKADYEGAYIYVKDKGGLTIGSGKNVVFDNTILSTKSNASAIYIETNDVNIDGTLSINNSQVGIYVKDVTEINLQNITMDTNKQGMYLKNSKVVLKDVVIKNSGESNKDGGAIYLSNGSLKIDNDIEIDNNINAIFNDGGKLYIRDPENILVSSNIEIKNGTGQYVLSTNKENGGEYYLLGGRIYQNNTDNVYVKKTSATTGSVKEAVFYIGGNFAIEVNSGKKGIHITDQEHEIFKEHSIINMTNDNRLSYYVEENATKIFSNFNNPLIDKDIVFFIEDANRDIERPMYLDQYEDTKDLYVYYKSIVLKYKYKYEHKEEVYDLNLQSNQHLPRRVLYNSTESVVIGSPVVGELEFKGWEGPGIATGSGPESVTLTSITDMTARCYVAHFEYVVHTKPFTIVSTVGGGGGGMNGGGGLPNEKGQSPEQAKKITLRTTDVFLMSDQCEWFYDIKTNSWFLNMDIMKHTLKAANGFYTIVSVDAQGKLIQDIYCFDTEGRMITGWAEDPNGDIYYFDDGKMITKGKMVTGWREVDKNTKYYFGVDGKLRLTVKDGKNIVKNSKVG